MTALALHTASSLEACPALVLNADFTPLSYYPLSLWPWQAAIRAIFLDRVDVVHTYDRTVRSAHSEMALPSVVALRDYVKPAKHPAFTRFNVFLRDNFCCQYCTGKTSRSDLTFDHVVPRARGGTTTWENIVAACQPCNTRKGSKSLKESGMHLLREPRRPTIHELQKNGRKFPPHYLHETWRDFLYWDTVLQDDTYPKPWAMEEPASNVLPLTPSSRPLGLYHPTSKEFLNGADIS